MTRQRTPRRFAVAVAVALVATACTSDAPEVDEVPVEAPESPTTPTGGTDADAAPTSTPPPGDDGASPAPTGTTAPDGGGSPDGADEGGGDDRLTPVDDDGGVGANGRAMLRGDRPSLVLEVDVQSGAEVDDAAITHLVEVLDGVTAKPNGIRLAGGNTFDSERTSWTAADLRRAARAHRSTSSTAEQVSVHVLYVRGSHVQDGEQTQAIGLAYSASTTAMFPERWEGLGSLLGSDRAIERAVLVHELGHLFGLVNLTYQSDIDHEDPEHPGHSSNRESVMFHAIETTAIGQVFSGPPPDTFDGDDRADLEGLRTGRY